MFKKKKRNAIVCKSFESSCFISSRTSNVDTGKKIAAIFWKVFLNVILEQNNKAIKAGNVCIANHHILSLHPQMQCQPLAWKLI